MATTPPTLTPLVGVPSTIPASRLGTLTGVASYDGPYIGGATGLGLGQTPFKYDATFGGWVTADSPAAPAAAIPFTLPVARGDVVGSVAPTGWLIIDLTWQNQDGTKQNDRLTFRPQAGPGAVLDLSVNQAPLAYTTPQSLLDLIALMQGVTTAGNTAITNANTAAGTVTAAVAAIPGQVTAGLAPVAPALASMQQSLADSAQATLSVTTRLSLYTQATALGVAYTVADQTGLSAITGMTTGQRATVTTELATYRYDGSSWIFESSWAPGVTTLAAVGGNKGQSATVLTAALQSLLSLRGHVKIGLAGTYLINNTLVIDSGTTLELGRGVTLQMAPNINKPILKNRAYVNGSGRDTDIEIMGGAINFDSATKAFSGLNSIAVILKSVDRLKIHDNIGLRGKKYIWLVADITDLTTYNLDFDTDSDGFHMQGPITRAKISNLKGTSHDDLLALTGGDYGVYQISEGAFTDIMVRGLFPNGALTAVKITGNPNSRFDDIDIEGIYGSTQHQAVYIQNDVNLVKTQIGRLRIADVHVDQGSTAAGNDTIGAVIAIKGGLPPAGNTDPQLDYQLLTIDELILENIESKNATQPSVVMVDTNVAIKTLTVSDAAMLQAVPADQRSFFKIVHATSSIGTLNIVRGQFIVGNHVYANLVRIDAGTITTLNLQDVKFTGGAAARTVRQVAGTLTNLNIIRGEMSGMNSVYDQTVTTLPAVRVTLDNPNWSAFPTGILFRSDATLSVSGGSYVPNGGGNPVVVSSGTTRITGRTDYGTSTNTRFVLKTGGTLSVSGDITVDISALTPRSGDRVFNINANVSPGLGLAAYGPSSVWSKASAERYRTTRSVAYTITLSEDGVWMDTSAGNLPCILPDATLCAGRTMVITNIGTANSALVRPKSGQFIGQAATEVPLAAGQTQAYYCDGTRWWAGTAPVTTAAAANAPLAYLDINDSSNRIASAANAQNEYEISTGTGFTEGWANLTAWSSSTAVQVGAGRAYSNGQGAASGINHSYAVGSGVNLRAVYEVNMVFGGASGGLIVGVSSDVAGAAVPNGATSVRGLYFSNNNVQSFDQGATTTLGTIAATTAFRVTLTVDQTYLTLTARATDGSAEYRVRWARAGFNINNLAVFNSDARLLTGTSVGAVSAVKSQSAKTGAVTTNTVTWTASNGDNLRLALPANHNPRVPTPLAICYHGYTTTETVFADNFNGNTVASALLAAGYMVLSAADTDGNPNGWGSDSGLSAYVNAYKWVRDSGRAIGPVVLYGNSMGGLESLLTLAGRRIPGIVAWAGSVPVTNLAAAYADTTNFQASVKTAYGIAADGSDYATKTAGHDPNLMNGGQFRGLPMLVIVATDDATVPPANNWNLFEPIIQPYASEYIRINTTGGHSASFAAFTSQIVAHFDKYAKII